MNDTQNGNQNQITNEEPIVLEETLIETEVGAPNTTVSSGEMTSEKALEILKQEKQEREEKCMNEVYAVLGKYNCTIDVAMILKTDRNIPQVTIVSK